MIISNRKLLSVAASATVLLAALIALVLPPQIATKLPPLTLKAQAQTLPDFTVYAAGRERKQAFADYLTPLIQQANQHVVLVRKAALLLANQADTLQQDEQAWLSQLCDGYKIEVTCLPSKALAEQIALRVNAVPVALALVQGAKESGWGTSRFARQGNNLFGQWCFKAGCGLVPKSRVSGASHEVAVFRSPLAAVAAYIQNINRHPAYVDVRQQRHNYGLDPQAMANGLSRYSERGEAYVTEVQKMLQHNVQWLALPNLPPHDKSSATE